MAAATASDDYVEVPTPGNNGAVSKMDRLRRHLHRPGIRPETPLCGAFELIYFCRGCSLSPTRWPLHRHQSLDGGMMTLAATPATMPLQMTSSVCNVNVEIGCARVRLICKSASFRFLRGWRCPNDSAFGAVMDFRQRIRVWLAWTLVL